VAREPWKGLFSCDSSSSVHRLGVSRVYGDADRTLISSRRRSGRRAARLGAHPGAWRPPGLGEGAPGGAASFVACGGRGRDDDPAVGRPHRHARWTPGAREGPEFRARRRAPRAPERPGPRRPPPPPAPRRRDGASYGAPPGHQTQARARRVDVDAEVGVLSEGVARLRAMGDLIGEEVRGQGRDVDALDETVQRPRAALGSGRRALDRALRDARAGRPTAELVYLSLACLAFLLLVSRFGPALRAARCLLTLGWWC